MVWHTVCQFYRDYIWSKVRTNSRLLMGRFFWYVSLREWFAAGGMCTSPHYGSDTEMFMNQIDKATEEDSAGVVGLIKQLVNLNRFTVCRSLRNGVVTVHWKDEFIYPERPLFILFYDL